MKYFTLRLWIIASGILFVGCDDVAKYIDRAKRPLDPIVGEWRQVVTDDTSSIETTVFSSDGSVRITVQFRKQGVTPMQKVLQYTVSEMRGKYSNGDGTLVLTLDDDFYVRRFIEGMKRESLDTSEYRDGDMRNTPSQIFYYSISGDIMTIKPKDGLQVEQMFTKVRK